MIWCPTYSTYYGGETMKFNSERLKFARIYNAMTCDELGEKVGLTKQTISFYENGNEPPLKAMFSISRQLNFPFAFFYTDDNKTVKMENTFYRALLSTTKKEKTAQTYKIEMLLRIFEIINEYVEFPRINLPNMKINIRSDKDIVEIARELREFWGLSTKPIKDMVYVMEKNGILVKSLDTHTQSIDAFTQYIDIDGIRYLCVVLEEEKTSAVRRQFSAAHELGHIILHSTTVNMDEVDRKEFREIERQANLFASEFLLPSDEFIKDLIHPTNLKCYEMLKNKWHVSILAMMMKALNLGVITDNQFKYLIKQYNILNYRKNEPLDGIINIPQPQLLKNSIEMLLENDVFTSKTLMKEFEKRGLPMNPREVEILFGLEEGRLKLEEEEENKIIPMNLKIKLKDEQK